MPQYNAKNLPLGDPYIAAENYGVTLGNAQEKLAKLYGARTEKAGGSKQIFDKLQKWASPEQIKSRGGNPNDTQWKYWQDYFKTGKVNPNMRADTALRGLGVGLSETARAQQHKKIGLLEKVLGPVLTIAASSIPVIGPYAGAAVGGYVGSRHGGGPIGTILGAAGGYIGGVNIAKAGGISGIYNSAKSGIGNLLSSGGFSNPSALGLTGANLALPGLSNAPATVGAAGFGAGALGPVGTVGLNFASGAMPGTLATNTNSINNVSAGVGRSLAEGGSTADDLYKPRSLGPIPADMSTPEKVFRGARATTRAVEAVNNFSNPQQPMAMGAAPMMGGGAPQRQMVSHGAEMIPYIPMPYPSNPFMARIV